MLMKQIILHYFVQFKSTNTMNLLKLKILNLNLLNLQINKFNKKFNLTCFAKFECLIVL